MNEKKFSVIIVSYNCLQFLQKCIQSITKYNDIGKALEVIVVDNSDNNEIQEWVKSVTLDLVYVKNDNRGFGQGNNVGARLSNGEFLLFLNPDTELLESVFKFAVEKFENDKKLGAFGVQLLDANGNRGPSIGGRVPFGFLQTMLCKALMTINVFYAPKMQTSGADLFIKRETFFDCGMFDEKIFMYCEEADLCNRIDKLNQYVKFFPEKKIMHHEGKTSDIDIVKRYSRELESREYYCHKYNKNFLKLCKREWRYCKFKQLWFLIKGNNEKENAFGIITEMLKKKIKTKK